MENILIRLLKLKTFSQSFAVYNFGINFTDKLHRATQYANVYVLENKFVGVGRYIV